MDHLWSPWRYRYVTKADTSDGCVFCAKPREQRDEENLILHRSEYCFAVLNLYPYTTGHMMVVPYSHVSTIEDLTPEEWRDVMDVTRDASRHLRATYRPGGMNIGMNLGECAGAGIAAHLHLHLLPRWHGDVNFMTAIGETRVHPEDLSVTYAKLSTAFRGL